jgi:hypothetical protein
MDDEEGWVAHVARMGQKINAYRILVGNPEELGRHRCRWDGNIKMNLKDIGWSSLNWIHLAQDKVQWRALVNTIMTLVTLNVGKFLSNWWLLKKDSASWSYLAG